MPLIARLTRPSVHDRASPPAACATNWRKPAPTCSSCALQESDGQPTARIELPMFGEVAMFLAVLESVAQAALACHLPGLILAGYPPPVDATVEWTTVTPDPAVIEINTAPSVDAESFLRRSREIYAAAADQGLAPYRLYFNGAVADSGGGGQITLGGPSPQASPFLQEPRLLPRLVRFLNRHPALSYLYSHDFVGSSGQSVRADERGTDAFDELAPDPGPAGAARRPVARTPLAQPGIVSLRCRRQQPSRRDEHRKAVESLPGRAGQAGPGGIPRPAHAAHAGAGHRPGLPAARRDGDAGKRATTPCRSWIGAANCTSALPCLSTWSRIWTPC